MGPEPPTRLGLPMPNVLRPREGVALVDALGWIITGYASAGAEFLALARYLRWYASYQMDRRRNAQRG